MGKGKQLGLLLLCFSLGSLWFFFPSFTHEKKKHLVLSIPGSFPEHPRALQGMRPKYACEFYEGPPEEAMEDDRAILCRMAEQWADSLDWHDKCGGSGILNTKWFGVESLFMDGYGCSRVTVLNLANMGLKGKFTLLASLASERHSRCGYCRHHSP